MKLSTKNYDYWVTSYGGGLLASGKCGITNNVENKMIHCMNDCLGKLKAIKLMAQVGMNESNDSSERNRFEQISMEVSYLIVEAEQDDAKRVEHLRTYRK